MKALKFPKLKDALKKIGKTFHEAMLDGILKAIQSEKRQNEYRPGDEEIAASRKNRFSKDKNERFFDPSLYRFVNGGSFAAITLASNCTKHDWFYDSSEKKKARMAKAHLRFDGRLHKDLIGRHFHKHHNYEKRLEGVFLFERASGNIHLHGIVHTNGFCHEELARLVQVHWSSVMPSGTTKVITIADGDGWLSYITKYCREDGIRALQGDGILFMPAVPVKDREPA